MKHISNHEHTTKVHYDSLTDLENDTFPNKRNEDLWSSYLREGGGESWWGWSGGFDNLKRLMSTGWKTGAMKIEENLKILDLPIVMGVRRKRKRGAFGDSIDMQSVYAGSLDRAWETTERVRSTNTGTNNAVVIVEVAVASRVGSHEAFWRGAAAVAVTDMLQRSGRSVMLVVVTSNVKMDIDNRNAVYSHSITVKDFDQPLDTEHAALLTSTGFYRGYMFKAKFLSDCRASDSLGEPVKYKIIPDFVEEQGYDHFYIDGNVLSLGRAKDYVNSVFERITRQEVA